jgi:ABC-2 type transport system permease protein
VTFGALLLPFRWPAQLHTYAVFAVAVLLAVLLSAAMRFLLGIGAFWLLDARGIHGLYASIAGLAGGLAVPLAYFPDAVQAALYATPFPGMLQTPIDVFTERGNTAALLGHQLLWLAVVVGVGRIALARGTRKLVVQGG